VTAAGTVRAPVRLRPMVAGDLDAVVRLERAAGGLSWTREMFARELEDQGSRVWLVAESDERRVVGYVGVILVVDAAHVVNVAVEPPARRAGLATRLMAAVLDEARRRGAAAATLEVRASNTGARELYRRLGFVPVGARPRYYGDTGEDAIIMWLHDLPDATLPVSGEG
jgi:[ribosomal protein S18]-alanine N-acetyltransferase